MPAGHQRLRWYLYREPLLRLEQHAVLHAQILVGLACPGADSSTVYSAADPSTFVLG